MEYDDFLLSEHEYQTIQQEYKKHSTPSTPECLKLLYIVILNLRKHGFNLPTQLKKYLLNDLFQSYHILKILYCNQIKTQQSLNNNPITLIYSLTTISLQLNKISLKTPYQILHIKANNIVLNTIKKISNHLLINL